MLWRMKDVLIVTVAMLAVAGLYWLATHQEAPPKTPRGLIAHPD